jgi:hypothetical protein
MIHPENIDAARSLLSTSDRLIEALPESYQAFPPIAELAVLLQQAQRLLAEPATVQDSAPVAESKAPWRNPDAMQAWLKQQRDDEQYLPNSVSINGQIYVPLPA